MLSSRRATRRRGVTMVEATVVLAVFLLLLFGIFEYCRFLLVLHITNNAARDGARYAVVNLDKPANFDLTDFSASKPSVKAYTTARMGGVWKQINVVDPTHSPVGFDIATYPCDPTGLTLTPPVIRAKTTDPDADGNGVYIYPDPFNQAAPFRTNWNNAEFTERIAVTIRGTYKPITPVFLLMPSSIPIRITAIMGSEG